MLVPMYLERQDGTLQKSMVGKMRSPNAPLALAYCWFATLPFGNKRRQWEMLHRFHDFFGGNNIIIIIITSISISMGNCSLP